MKNYNPILIAISLICLNILAFKFDGQWLGVACACDAAVVLNISAEKIKKFL